VRLGQTITLLLQPIDRLVIHRLALVLSSA